MSNAPLQITSPVGRMVGGSLYDPRDKDYDGNPLVVKSGPNAGKPRVDYNFGVAFPKTPGVQHWSQEAWLAPIYGIAQAAFPGGDYQRPDFAWKIIDGDSAIPNKKNKKPCDQEGYLGHWVLWFSGSNQPRIFNRDGTQQLLDKDAVKPGYYVQVFFSVKDNKPSKSAGLYLNHSMIALAGIGPEIVFGPDVSAAGFGQAALPPGAQPFTGQPIPPSAGMPNAGTPAPMPPIHGMPAPMPPAAPTTVPVAEVMIEGRPKSAWNAAGWTDEMLIQHGKMPAPVPTTPAAPPAVPAPLAPVGSAPMPAAPAPTVVAPPPSPVTPSPDMRAVPAPEVMIEGRPKSAWHAAGWTDEMLIQHGKMAA